MTEIRPPQRDFAPGKQETAMLLDQTIELAHQRLQAMGNFVQGKDGAMTRQVILHQPEEIIANGCMRVNNPCVYVQITDMNVAPFRWPSRGYHQLGSLTQGLNILFWVQTSSTNEPFVRFSLHLPRGEHHMTQDISDKLGITYEQLVILEGAILKGKVIKPSQLPPEVLF